MFSRLNSKTFFMYTSLTDMSFYFTKVLVSDAGLEDRKEVISFPFLLKQEAGVAFIRQMEVHCKRIWR